MKLQHHSFKLSSVPFALLEDPLLAVARPMDEIMIFSAVFATKLHGRKRHNIPAL